MKKDTIALPLLPFIEDEETALTERLTAMDSVALGHYADSARQALGNRALDASWRPRIQHGLERAEEVIAAQALLEPVVAEEAPPETAKPAKATRAKKAAAKAEEAAPAEESDEAEAEPAET